jgi:hypothetical protein
MSQLDDETPGNPALIFVLRDKLYPLLFRLWLILFVINILIPRGPLHANLDAALGWLLLIVLVIMPFSPFWSIVKTAGYVLSGRLRFPRQRIGEIVTDDQGRQYTVFRQIVVAPTRGKAQDPGAILTLHFKVTNLTPRTNQLYSLLPLPLYLGDPGFRSKLFTIHGEDCQSIYEWDSARNAEKYVQSIALKSILLRSVPGSFKVAITPAMGHQAG